MRQAKPSKVSRAVWGHSRGFNAARKVAAYINAGIQSDDERFHRSVSVTGRGISLFMESAFAEVFNIEDEDERMTSYVVVIGEHELPIVFKFEDVRVSQYEQRIPMEDVIIEE